MAEKIQSINSIKAHKQLKEVREQLIDLILSLVPENQITTRGGLRHAIEECCHAHYSAGNCEGTEQMLRRFSQMAERQSIRSPLQ